MRKGLTYSKLQTLDEIARDTERGNRAQVIPFVTLKERFARERERKRARPDGGRNGKVIQFDAKKEDKT